MLNLILPTNKKIYFASDFHLGTPTKASSDEREKTLIAWFDRIQADAMAIFLLGDIFDFWFEYKNVIPKGFFRLQNKLAELSDSGIQITLFTGNHDVWMFDYLSQELRVTIQRHPIQMQVGKHTFLIGHGDGLGLGDTGYKWLKRIFTNSFCQWLFSWIHPDIGISFAHYWSRKSRISNQQSVESFQGEDNEHLFSYCRHIEKTTHHDFYVFGHRHLALDLPVTNNSRYINTGEWVYNPAYAEYDGQSMILHKIKKT